MDEVKRQQYLDAFGIDSYIPVKVLPGALPSNICDWPENLPVFLNTLAKLDAGEAISSPSIGSLADKNALIQLQRDLGSQRKVSVTGSSSAPTEKPLEVSAASSNVVTSFHWAIFQPVSELLLLVPAQHTDAACLQLLKNVLQAISLKADNLSPRDNFIWPPRVDSSSKIDNTLSAAGETLNSLLEGYQLKGGVKNILLFTGSVGEKIFSEEVCLQKRRDGLFLYLLPELQQMLENSQYKKIAWQKICSLGS